MVNSVGISQGQCVVPTKANGKSHCRKDELTAYRETIAIANQHMISSALAKDNDAVACWSKIIDDSQAKIFAIIEQEDNHSYKKVDVTTSSVKTAVDSADKVVDSAMKVTGAVVGSKLSIKA